MPTIREGQSCREASNKNAIILKQKSVKNSVYSSSSLSYLIVKYINTIISLHYIAHFSQKGNKYFQLRCYSIIPMSICLKDFTINGIFWGEFAEFLATKPLYDVYVSLSFSLLLGNWVAFFLLCTYSLTFLYSPPLYICQCSTVHLNYRYSDFIILVIISCYWLLELL